MSACAAKNSFFTEFLFWPDSRIFTTCSLMTFVARIIGIAAIEFDRNAVDFLVVMCTACLGVYIATFYNFTFDEHSVSSLKSGERMYGESEKGHSVSKKD